MSDGEIKFNATSKPIRDFTPKYSRRRHRRNFCLYVVPSLDLVLYNMGGSIGQYDPALTGLPQPAADTLRDDWKPLPRTPFSDGSLGGEDCLRRTRERVCASIVD